MRPSDIQPGCSTPCASQGSPRLFPVVTGAAVLAALLAWLTPYNDYYIGGTYVANHHVPVVASVVLALIAAVINPLLARLRQPSALSRLELAAAWIVLAVPSGIASSGLMRFLIPVLPAVRYYATPANRFEELLWPVYPPWLVPTDEAAIRAFYEGAAGPMWPLARAWLAPALTWSAIMLLAWWLMFAAATILRRQWCDHERMSFPHVYLPLEIINSSRGLDDFFSSRLTWIGIALPVVLYGLIGLHEFIPSVPKPRFLWPEYYRHALRLRTHPWSAVPPILLAFFPSMVGFGYLVTAEVSLSVWLSYVLLTLETAALAATGIRMKTVTSGTGRWQFSSFQDMGAYLVLIGSILYVARPHLTRVWQAAMRGSGHDQTTGEPLGYRWLVLSALTAFATLVGIFAAAGLSVGAALAFFIPYFMVCTVLAWATSNTGLLLVGCTFRPQDYLYYLVGTRSLARSDIALIALPSRAMSFYYREYLLPHFLNAYKLADETALDRRSAAAAAWLGVIVVLPVAWLAHLWLAYTKGAVALQPLTYRSWAPVPFRAAVAYITNPSAADPIAYVFLAIGALTTLIVISLRARFSWWPLHPVGIILASGPAREIWLSMFIAWLCKVLILRYGGHKAYRAGRNLFMGMALGEAVIATLWIAVGLVTHVGVRLLP